MRRRPAPHCAFRKMGPPIGDIHPRPSEIPTRDMSTVTKYIHFVHEDTSRVVCSLGLPRIAYSRKCAHVVESWWLRHFASLGRLRVTIRSVLGETRQISEGFGRENEAPLKMSPNGPRRSLVEQYFETVHAALQIHSNIDAPSCSTT